jgi:hypothetical protein
MRVTVNMVNDEQPPQSIAVTPRGIYIRDKSGAYIGVDGYWARTYHAAGEPFPDTAAAEAALQAMVNKHHIRTG